MFKSIILEVIGADRLNCEGCEERVESALKRVPGVGQVRANSGNQRIKVLFDSALLDASAITEHVAKVGYQTKVVSAPDPSTSTGA